MTIKSIDITFEDGFKLTLDADDLRALAAAGTPVPIEPERRCPFCKGTGRALLAEYCSCKMGRDLRRAERRDLEPVRDGGPA